MSRLTKAKVDYPFYPCVCVSWDNTARRDNNAIVMINSTPENFESGLSEVIQSVIDKPYDDRLVFINAWNEWAEGMHLEPDVKNGRKYLEAVKRANVIQ
jgi:lipopolysaccharide biosynthesis protein